MGIAVVLTSELRY